MTIKILETLEVQNTIVELAHDTKASLYMVRIRDSKTNEVLNTTCYSEYSKAISHVKAYKL